MANKLHLYEGCVNATRMYTRMTLSAPNGRPPECQVVPRGDVDGTSSLLGAHVGNRTPLAGLCPHQRTGNGPSGGEQETGGAKDATNPYDLRARSASRFPPDGSGTESDV